MNEKSKQLKRMATWTAAVFATIFAVVMTVLWIPLFNAGATAFEAIGKAFTEGWLLIVISLVLCVGAYMGYSMYINRKK
jgi:uncharacterized membrane protein